MSGYSSSASSSSKEKTSRLLILIRGAVQGVGFRPFVYRLAHDLGLKGWVSNSAQGVIIEVEGKKETLADFLSRLKKEKPAHASIQDVETSFLNPVYYKDFTIRESEDLKTKTTAILPDIATCPDCLNEIIDPGNRRYSYPFTNCTNCGPRFSIITAIPYDRANTTMKEFKMCKRCLAEYKDPSSRRFHAQPNACPDCGPHLELWNREGKRVAAYHEAFVKTVAALRAGKIVALKGLGGFQLLVDARNNQAIVRLRQRKHREEKPLALLFPSLRVIREHCHVTPQEGEFLNSSEAPIVLLNKVSRQKPGLAPSVAPENPYLGAMLAYTPLHHMLMRKLNFPVVATSGNLSDEPICIDEKEALKRLKGIADLFLVHNRPIARHMDDSVVRLTAGRMMVLRRARGFAPAPVSVSNSASGILAAGAHLKNTVALSLGDSVVVSQHLGDLETKQSLLAFGQSVKDLPALYDARIKGIACDMHPEYLSSKYTKGQKASTIAVQHHHAHIVSCMSENGIADEVLGVAWDGTGFGLDGTIWGGEFLMSTLSDFKRVGYFRTFKLPGNEAAIKEPRRAALGVLFEIFGEKVFEMKELLCVRAFSQKELETIAKMILKDLNTPVTSSVGRLFDAVSSIVGLYHKTSFEGQAAMALEYVLEGKNVDKCYNFNIFCVSKNDKNLDGILVVDWEPIVKEVLSDLKSGLPAGEISAKFHNTLAEVIVGMAKRTKAARICLSGGCFQNKYLTEKAIFRMKQEGLKVFWHNRIPPNDGGISLGQAVVASFKLKG
ncbi:MAG TPA: carbamoyltransferase HypF [Candidatus Omnitrophota bacterium]|nr:carbamoyltransferase HypF [Candidatus Omnitrophota bacterium]HPD84916.1 carbamoyltransferase HypF [Candidatus Omnitrophota bacterium]HRZ03774.1 carbamoyltransferase HypF [Candidatus Omnitrophota bacterium]